MTKIKICGITSREDIELINEFLPEYAGFVMFYPKSKRNISAEKAVSLLSALDKRITTVAVTVSPDEKQVAEIASCGFDLVQIHGNLTDEVLNNSSIPILRAVNVKSCESKYDFPEHKNIVGYVFDAASPGSGKTFDWELLGNIPRDSRLFMLAGGLNSENVLQAIERVNPDIIDVSSGVENDCGKGKSRAKVEGFISLVRGKQPKK